MIDAAYALLGPATRRNKINIFNTYDDYTLNVTVLQLLKATSELLPEATFTGLE